MTGEKFRGWRRQVVTLEAYTSLDNDSGNIILWLLKLQLAKINKQIKQLTV